MVGTLENAGTVDAGKWYLATTEGGTATLNAYKDTDGTDWANVGIIAKGSQDYSVQLIGHYDAKAGYVYKVSFDAYATGNMVGQKVNCDSKEWKGWGTYGITSFTLGSEAQSYSFLVDQEEAFDDCRIEFNLGARESGNVFISNVKVEIVDPTSLNQEGVHTALADGNIIYNGTFDQGVDHVGYWRASEGTTLTVPRYTKEDLTGKDVSVEDVASTLNSYEKLTDGVKYYERRAQITSQTGVAAEIYQTDLTMPADSYTLSFDLYSKADTSVTAAIYRVNVTDDGKTLGDKILSTTTSYTAGSGVKPYKWSFKTTEDVENAALVLTFADGASVWLDNVKLLGESLGEEVDQNPIDSDTNWEAANGTITSAGVIDGVAKFTGITSGTVWYSPQIASDVFSMATGKNYEISFKYKLGGNYK